MSGTRADLWWLPVGAGGHVVIHTSRWWEWLRARREHRSPARLFHAALEITGEGRQVIEMAPAWGQPRGERGVVATGPVGLAGLGALGCFRYEVRCWQDGCLPDREWAVGGPVPLPLAGAELADLVARVPTVPRLVWGRDEFGIGDMWNSNSLISWLLQTSGVDAARILPPDGGSAPGWQAGITAAGG